MKLTLTYGSLLAASHSAAYFVAFPLPYAIEKPVTKNWKTSSQEWKVSQISRRPKKTLIANQKSLKAKLMKKISGESSKIIKFDEHI